MRHYLVIAALLLTFGGCDSGSSSGGSTTPTATPDDPPEPETSVFRIAVVSGSSYPDGTFVFMVNGEENAELTLTRGETYTFEMANTPAHHPFHISTGANGADGGSNEWAEGITGNFATGDEILTFAVPGEAPNLLYYQCPNHELMGGKINIVS